MYSLSAPIRVPLDDYDSIVDRRTNPAKNALQLARTNVSTAYAEYHQLSGDGSRISPLALIDPLPRYLRDNFGRLDRGKSHQEIRDRILASAIDDRCAYCNYHTVDSLDHLLPRSVYPEFSVLSENLVPVCATCNRTKGETCDQVNGVTVVHPYFDQIPATPILFVEVTVEPDRVSWIYHLRNDGSVDATLFDSIEALFEQLALARLYARVSVGDVSEHATEMARLFASGGEAQVRTYLLQEAASVAHRRGENYWRTAVLRALADNDDFCDGGFRHLT